MLARDMAARGEAVPNHLMFEEVAGLVPVRLLRDGAEVVGAELTAPEPLSRRSRLAPEVAAALLTLRPEDVCTNAHGPEVVSVGLPFLVGPELTALSPEAISDQARAVMWVCMSKSKRPQGVAYVRAAASAHADRARRAVLAPSAWQSIIVPRHATGPFRITVLRP